MSETEEIDSGKTDLIKAVLRITVSLGAGKITGSIIRSHLGDLNKIQKITVPVAAYAIGGVVADRACDHVDGVVDDAVEKIEKIRAKINEKKTTPTE